MFNLNKFSNLICYNTISGLIHWVTGLNGDGATQNTLPLLVKKPILVYCPKSGNGIVFDDVGAMVIEAGAMFPRLRRHTTFS
jgi:hypothetical protein